ncbi:phosphodiester glycosidase family protein [Candidatus Poribacteria bacterium]|nr:phosphodiester glycosidase family protein [Candidatus Poribacteria bacterium]
MFDIVYLIRQFIGFIRRYPRTFTLIGLLCLFGIGIWVGREIRFEKIPNYFKSYTDPVQSDETNQIFPGITHRQILDDGVLTNILAISADAASVGLYRALSAGIGTEYLRSFASRYKAPIALNGGFFEMAGQFRGESVGALKIDGEWVSEPEQGRGVFGFKTVNDKIEAYIDRIILRQELVFKDGSTIEINGINRGRLSNELILYQPDFHAITLTMPDGIEVVVKNKKITDIRNGEGSSRIPSNGYVLSAHGKKREILLSQLKLGDSVNIRETVIPEVVGESKLWEGLSHVIGGGPLLLRNGVISTKDAYKREGFQSSFYGFPHPRTAVGKKEDGTLLFVTITGAEPGVRRGVTLPKLGKLFQEWEATDAINLDGGSSSMMIIRNKVVSIKPKPKETESASKDKSKRAEKKPEQSKSEKQTVDKQKKDSAEPNNTDKPKQDIAKKQVPTKKRSGEKSKEESNEKKQTETDNSPVKKEIVEQRKYGYGNLRIRPTPRNYGRSISDAILIFPRKQNTPNKKAE